MGTRNNSHEGESADGKIDHKDAVHSRRTHLKLLATTGLSVGGLSVSSKAASDPSFERLTVDDFEDFDPIEKAEDSTNYYETFDGNNTLDLHDASVTIKRVPYLVKVNHLENGYYGYDEPGYLYHFGMYSMGITNHRLNVDVNDNRGTSSARIFNSKHRMSLESNTYGLGDIKGRLNPDVVNFDSKKWSSDVYNSADDWLTDEDLSNVDTEENENMAVAGLGLAVGIAGTAASGGVATLLGASGVALSANSFAGELLGAESGDEKVYGDEKWEREQRETTGWGIFTEVEDISLFQHSAHLPLYVPEGQSDHVTITDYIGKDPSPPNEHLYEESEMESIINENQESSFDIQIPANTGDTEGDSVPNEPIIN